MIINDYFKFDNNELFEILKKYIKINPCCELFPKCNHPKYQSDSNLFNIENNNINIIKNNYFNCLLKILNKNKLDIIQNKVWAYLTLKNENTQSEWHNHIEIKNNNINISGLLYITETNVGTEFKTKFLNIEIIPHINRWFLWDSSIIHKPKNMISKEDRIVIATSTILKN
jgi:hypothetical protein